MNIESKELELSCFNLKNDFSNYFDWNDMDVTFFRVDVTSKKINSISSNYEWKLIYWDDDLDLLVNERLTSGIQYWNNYSEAYAKTLAKTDKRAVKVDFCTQYGNTYDVISINTKHNIPITDMMKIYKYRPTIADYAHRAWRKNDDLALPLRANNITPANLQENSEDEKTELLDIHQYMRFGNVRFTKKEIITIRLLLSHCRIKEISAIQGCSEASENKRIQRIKEKLDCPHVSSSGLFSVLKENGITLACLETLVRYP